MRNTEQHSLLAAAQREAENPQQLPGTLIPEAARCLHLLFLADTPVGNELRGAVDVHIPPPASGNSSQVGEETGGGGEGFVNAGRLCAAGLPLPSAGDAKAAASPAQRPFSPSLQHKIPALVPQTRRAGRGKRSREEGCSWSSLLSGRLKTKSPVRSDRENQQVAASTR